MKSFSPVLIIAIIFIGLGIVPSTAVHAAWMAPLGDGTMYSEPPELAPGVPGYVPYGDFFTAIKGTSSETILNPAGTQNVGLVVTKDMGSQRGAIWSNSPIFNFNQSHQSVSMDLLIKSKNNNPADGMAFVLAGTNPGSLASDGGSIGVWRTGSYMDLSGTGENNPPTRIQNSLAITFDTHANTKSGNNTDDLDTLINYGTGSQQYLGFNYPDQDNTYQLKHSGSYSSRSLRFTNDTANSTFSAPLDYRPYDAGITLVSPSTASQDLWHVFEVSWDRTSNSGGILTYKLDHTGPADANGIAPAVTRQVPLTYAAIDKVLGTAANRTAFIGFTGSTGTFSEANVLAFRTIPGIVNASGTVTLTKTDSPSTIIDANSILKTNDQLTYHYSVNYDSSSTQSWPSNTSQKLSMVIPKQKYFKALSDQVTLTNSAGTMIGTATLDASDPTQFVIDNLPSFPKGTASTIKFNIPIAVDATVDGTLPKGGDPVLFGIIQGQSLVIMPRFTFQIQILMMMIFIPFSIRFKILVTPTRHQQNPNSIQYLISTLSIPSDLTKQVIKLKQIQPFQNVSMGFTHTVTRFSQKARPTRLIPLHCHISRALTTSPKL
ncbi:lectin-like domain-containing protein [Lacticaseibacillus saniviri]|uniref:lectin-like domain-containing protein n=1 Tax=Lacticaseibacillus saniviri TaxID=931533 RepID=UPI0006D2166B|nr:hypothetical protein [Lacticaseibacillus saniviri]